MRQRDMKKVVEDAERDGFTVAIVLAFKRVSCANPKCRTEHADLLRSFNVSPENHKTTLVNALWNTGVMEALANSDSLEDCCAELAILRCMKDAVEQNIERTMIKGRVIMHLLSMESRGRA